MTIYKPDPNKIRELLLSDIEADPDWNSRSGNWTVDSGAEESQDFSDFVRSIEQKGQEEPVDVQLTANPEKPYSLVAGYRRYRAISTIAAKGELQNVTIRAIVRDYDEVEARERNLAENVSHENITTPDFAWGLYQLQLASKKAGKELSDSAIAARLGRNQSYVNKLLSIMRDTKPSIAKRWRTMPRAVPVQAMIAVSRLPKPEQDEAFAQLLGQVTLKEDGEVKAKTGWFEGTRKKANDFGSVLGKLERMGLIDTTNLDFESHLELCISVKETASAQQRRALATQMNKGYTKALSEVNSRGVGVTEEEE